MRAIIEGAFIGFVVVMLMIVAIVGSSWLFYLAKFIMPPL
jgi:hypothetical protein